MNKDKIEKILTYLSKDMMEKVLHKEYSKNDMSADDPFVADALNLLLHTHEYFWGDKEARRVANIMKEVMEGKREVPKNRYQEMN